MPDAFHFLRPRTRQDRRAAAGILLGLVFAVLFGGYRVYHGYHASVARAENWTSVVATIADARSNPTPHGPARLYNVQVLVRYSYGGRDQQRWITLDQPRSTFYAARFQESQLKGKHCFVRWNPANPAEIVAEIH